MKRTIILTLIIAAVACLSLKKGDDYGMFKVPAGWPAPVYDFKASPLMPGKIMLGRMLFFEPRLSRDATVSCASCHLPQTAFTHVDHDLSHGIDNHIGTRNAPALQNLAWSRAFMWDGAVHHLDVQSLAPITNPLEMDEKIEHVVAGLQKDTAYKRLYREAYGDTGITGERTLKALSAFMLTAVSADAKYDQVMRGTATFNEWEGRGYLLFKAQCASCHSGPLFTNGGFENNGLPADTTLNDEGYFKTTGKAADRHKFKVPSLRNVEVTYPYMHDGRFRSLQMVLFHYTNGIAHGPTLSSQLRKGIHLTEEEKGDLIAFLKTLTDENFLHNASLQPVPASKMP